MARRRPGVRDARGAGGAYASARGADVAYDVAYDVAWGVAWGATDVPDASASLVRV
ncbi:hypothetical protein [Streptomyces sp. TRM49041]|uniref:hypothetical protein n=1 Tax=Streptomyces sp. TRM49041 TaxID=2603216 RepID=UPI001656899F|nr:hypothetical protein [Streptomyces sp. TRM49041]